MIVLYAIIKGRLLLPKPYRPWKVIYHEEFPTRAEAMQKEKWLKSGAGRKELKKILDARGLLHPVERDVRKGLPATKQARFTIGTNPTLTA